MAEDIKKGEIEDAALEAVAGGWDSDADAVCPKCKKGVRVGHKILDNGTKVRVCVKCGTAIDE